MPDCQHNWRIVSAMEVGGLPIPGEDGQKRYLGIWYCTKCRLVEPTTGVTFNAR